MAFFMGFNWYQLSPVILTDDIYFTNIATCNNSGTVAQRQVAYLGAEQMMAKHLSTLLRPTSVSGTFLWPAVPQVMILPHQHVISIDSVTVTNFDDSCSCTLTDNEACGVIRDAVGYVDLRVIGRSVSSQCGSCGSGAGWYYQAIVIYTAGLPDFVADGDTSLQLALSIIAEEVLNEILDPGASPGGPGAPGITGWSSLGYSETMNKGALKVGAAGASGRVNFAYRLVKHLHKKMALRF